MYELSLAAARDAGTWYGVPASMARVTHRAHHTSHHARLMRDTPRTDRGHRHRRLMRSGDEEGRGACVQ
eukprot:1769768-Pleurochrysis_carterae.AAC.1